MNQAAAWPIGSFTRHGEVLGRRPEAHFDCPVLGASVDWAAKDVFNPAAVVRDGRLYLLFRGEDQVGTGSGTSRIGLAVSDDGFTFSVATEPVLYPEPDAWHPWDWPGGCEDPRVVEAPEGGYVCVYTAFDGKTSCLFAATSDDLQHWEKHGPTFAGTPYVRRWSKSGAILTEVRDGRLVAARIDGRYWMYWGEGTCFAATSEDLVHWAPLEFDAGADRYLTHRDDGGTGSWDVHRVPGQRVLRPVLFPRPGRFDALLVEPGPPAVMTAQGVVLIYNGAQLTLDRDGTPVSVHYRPGMALLDAAEPASPIWRDTDPLALAGPPDFLEGQVNDVCFAQALVLFRGSWFLYYGMADSRIGCATAPLHVP